MKNTNYGRRTTGWDILFEEPHRMVEWVRLGRRRFYPRTEQEGKTAISAPDFDRIIGHATALVDALASCFAQDLIKAYPDAKVVLNLRGDIDAWQRSATINIAAGSVTPAFMYLHWFDRELWWMWHVYIRVLWKGLFQCFDGQLMSGIGKNGWRIYEQHVAMVRGLCKGREDDMYLEWKVEDGWGPLCEFLGKQVPDKPFPRANDRKAFKVREQDILRRTGFRAVRNLAIFVTTLVTAGLSVWWRM